MDETLLEQLLAKYHQGTITPEEQQQLDNWYASFDEVPATEPFRNALDEVSAKERLQARIMQSVEGEQPVGIRRMRHRWLYSAAAVLLLITVSIPLYRWLNKPRTVAPVIWQEASAKAGRMVAMTLSDGSRVWLNASSSLRYPAAFSDSSREIWLTEGEAFFDIAPDNKKPFIVHSGKLAVQVLGTSFNVCAYTQLKRVSISVATGKVQVQEAAKPLGILIASRQLNWDRETGATEIQDYDASRVGTWKDGLIRLDGASFSELAVTLKNIYGYTLTTSARRLQQASYTATFKNTGHITDVMKMICRMQQANYEKKDSVIVIY
ncbi:MAG TPA: FecR domain-containing protein [Chitinophaga sp.]|uniref:FecR family protein n=1 Tax=Chitinophaga sp. TaxID=1869181 RepID=UPI002CE65B0A|nr:FecR domain-containing protein [Chitinophaga sp.]HVI44028.1 FecR domain-containing protein [Chitinophaga sp.]